LTGWNEDSPELRENLARIARRILLEAPERPDAELSIAREWHRGNSRTARFWANWIAVRYGLPMFVRLRPRPAGSSYVHAARAALCDGDYRPSIAAFRELFARFVASQE